MRTKGIELLVVGDFSKAMILAETPDGLFNRIDHGIDLTRKFSITTHNTLGDHATFHFLGAPGEGRSLIPDPSKGDIAVYSPSQTAGQKVVLYGNGNLEIAPVTPDSMS